MPRLSPRLFRRAGRLSPHLATLLPACRTVESATNELRWIREHVVEATTNRGQQDRQLQRLCRRRGQGVPLQYILGSQPFGSLDIKCRPGVLIPRPETEAYTCFLADLIKSGHFLGPDIAASKDGLSIVDFCTGTGCIPTLLFASLAQYSSRLQVYGVDVSATAVKLAQDNVSANRAAGCLPSPTSEQCLSFVKGDIFNDEDLKPLLNRRWDVIVSNPPYISRDTWEYGRGQIGYSVRKYEPRLALVPGETLPVFESWASQDVFYARLLELAAIKRPKVLLLELGDDAQAQRILQHLATDTFANECHVEVWRDWPDLQAEASEDGQFSVVVEVGTWTVPVRGSGQVRSICLRRISK